MSIDRQMDSFWDESGLTPIAEVIPESACQVFEPVGGVVSDVAEVHNCEANHEKGASGDALREARAIVDKLLRS